MAHYRASESKREPQFRRYLKEDGVLHSLKIVLLALYEETEKVDNPLDFIKHLLDLEALRELQWACELLILELRNRLLQYEPAPEAGAAE